jgi:translation initiation factor 2 subunit 1
MQLTCRFYKNQFPDTDELVMVNVAEIQEMGVDVNLLEYSDQQGSMICLSIRLPLCFLLLRYDTVN